MKKNFTPAPWFQSHRKKKNGMYSTEVYCDRGETIASVAWYQQPRNKDGWIGTSREGNAKLIALAPSMFNLLERVDSLDGKCNAILLGDIKRILSNIN